MTIAVALLAGALAASWFVPTLLQRIDLRRHDPLPLIVAWLVSMAGTVLAVVTGVGLLLAPDHGGAHSVLAVIHWCWAALRHGSPPSTDVIAGLSGVVLLLAFLVRLLVVAARGAGHRARRREEKLAVLRLAARRQPGSPATLWLAHDRPLAFSLAGGTGVVVATEGLVRHLDRGAVDAVLEHERAHLRGRHHLLVTCADVLSAALPFTPLFRNAPSAIRQLVELAADTAAARSCGPSAVHRALLGIAGGGTPRTALAMGDEAVEVRLARLRGRPAQPGAVSRMIFCGLTGMTAAVLPTITGACVLLGLVAVTCPAG
ncbi:peptidase [Prauserella marina]|uniref:Peptidase family M48 n=1 Tax=Prauserella marina TaxID=530584 RepID=A0A222VSZ7_9PSEU|nr:M56 family metallopeptidase [Prauserella marina]ASR37047.1 peptidase [Prauserella marina]PWV79974.1 peptidase M48-like protein [Prauserella marina]SDD85883.1 Peptidase family M48 [Prauserella marina]